MSRTIIHIFTLSSILEWSRFFSTFLFGFAFFSLASPTFAATPIGLWYVEGGAAQVEIRPCDDTLCGRVVWLRSPLGEYGCELHDRHNPDVTLRNRTILGLEVLRGLKLSDAEQRMWTGGTIYDPTNGKTYMCNLKMEGDHQLHLRGYLGIPLLGRTTTWIRVGSDNQPCQQ
jgi:uncharacterized protein (DUF2147 family)